MQKNWLMPGVAVAVSVIPSLLLPFFWDHLAPWAKAAWIATIIALIVVEIRTIHKERDAHDDEMKATRKQADADRELQQQRFERTMERFEDIRRAADSRFLAVERLINNPVKGLARKALELSKSILDFIYDRMLNVPPLPLLTVNYVGGSYEDYLKNTVEYRRLMTYEEDTLKYYTARFQTHVIALRGEFAAKGLTDPELEALYKDPKESGWIRVVGERLGALAEAIEKTDAASA